MKIQYHLPQLSFKERIFCHYVLLDEIEKQNWYAVLINPLTNEEEFLSLQ